jgi:hypothetical protein
VALSGFPHGRNQSLPGLHRAAARGGGGGGGTRRRENAEIFFFFGAQLKWLTALPCHACYPNKSRSSSKPAAPSCFSPSSIPSLPPIPKKSGSPLLRRSLPGYFSPLVVRIVTLRTSASTNILLYFILFGFVHISFQTPLQVDSAGIVNRHFPLAQ